MRLDPHAYPTLIAALDAQAARRPQHIVLRRIGFRSRPHEELSFSGLRAAAGRFADALAAVSTRGDRVLLAYPSSNDFVVAFIGCLMAGRIAVPVSLGTTQRSGERIAAVAADCDARILVCPNVDAPGIVSAALPQGCHAMNHETLATGQGAAAAAGSVDAQDIAFLQYTSGSTGTPKGVIVTHANLAANLRQIFSVVGNHHRRIVSWLPQFHDMGLIGTMLFPVFTGMQTSYMSPLEFVQRPARWIQAMSEFRASGSVAPNFGFSYVLERLRPGDLESVDLSSVSTLMCGSEPIDARTLQRFVHALAGVGLDPRSLMPTYGLAEATLMVTAAPLGRGLTTGAFDPMSKRAAPVAGSALGKLQNLVACGQIAPGMTARALGPDGAPCAEGVEGEIAIDGPNVCSGYWGHPPRTGPLRTGDLGYFEGGDLFITGRKKDLIIVRGRNLYPTDVEAIARSCTPGAGANTSAAISYPAPDGTEALLVAQEVPQSALKDRDPETIRQAIAAEVADSHSIVPDQVLLLRKNAIPRTTSGKISRSGLGAALARGELTDAYIQPAALTGAIDA